MFISCVIAIVENISDYSCVVDSAARGAGGSAATEARPSTHIRPGASLQPEDTQVCANAVGPSLYHFMV